MTQPTASDVAIGRISRMDAIYNKAVAEASLQQAGQKLRNLRNVLADIDAKAFGLCQKCQQPIPIGRLLIRPESVFCVNCAR